MAINDMSTGDPADSGVMAASSYIGADPVTGEIGWGGFMPSEIPSGVNPVSALPNAGPVPTYQGQGGPQVGGVLNIGLPGGGSVAIGAGTPGMPAGASAGPFYAGAPGAMLGGGFQASGLLLLILAAVVVYIFVK